MPFLKPAMALAVALSTGGAAAQQPDPGVAGRNVAASCSACHGTNGQSKGPVASLAGRSPQDLVSIMREYKAGTRAGTIMPQLAKGYTDDQIELAAGWLAAQKPAN